MVDKYGTDPIRYYLLKEIPAYDDGDFSESRFKEVYNADLANGLGNLVARVAKLCEKAKIEVKKANDLSHFSKEVNKFLTEFKFDEALKFIWEKISQTDHYLDEKKPWLLKENEIGGICSNLVQRIQEISVLLTPFLPETTEKIKKQFQGPRIKSEKPLFPRLA